MRLQDLNWMDVERYLEKDNRIILVTGSTEQHAYLSLLTDVLIPAKIAEAVAQQEKVLVAPPLNFGVSRHWQEFPGTISLSPQTFEHVILELFESLCHHGFQKFLIVNGHGGNKMPTRFEDFQEGNALRVIWHNWWRSEALAAFEKKHDLTSNHANWSENFPFNRVADSPSETKPPVETGIFSEPYISRAVVGDGNLGGPYQIDDDLMNELFAAVVAEIAALVRSLAAEG